MMILPKKRKSGFTLVELLVVILVIALLAVILVPALAAAKEQGKSAVCKSNSRQLFLANSAYAIENEGFYVIAAEDIYGSNLLRWHGARNSIDEPFDPMTGPLATYLADGKVKRCPSFGKKSYSQEAGQSANFEAGCGGYGYNDQYVGGVYGVVTSSARSAKDSKIKLPALTVMFTDTAFRQILSDGQTSFIEYSFAHPPFWSWYIEMLTVVPEGTSLEGITGRPDPAIHFRHRGFTDVAWCDGHISKETMDLSAPYVTHAVMTEQETAAMALGWFGPDDNSLFDLK